MRSRLGVSMGDDAVIVEGIEHETSQDALLLFSVHGAGRVMNRTKTAGKWRKRWVCGDRDGNNIIEIASPNQTPGKGACPQHPGARPRKIRMPIGGAVDWPAMQAEMNRKKIELRGGRAEEAPRVYKHLPEVLAAHDGQIRVLHTLTPIGVAMAAADEFDPFKD